jgi:hypothetical protein
VPTEESIDEEEQYIPNQVFKKTLQDRGNRGLIKSREGGKSAHLRN